MDTASKLESLCKHHELYPSDFFREYGEADKFWSGSSWFQREASLRHDMVCLLLCNLETIEVPLDAGETPSKRRKLEVEATATSSSSGSSGASSSVDTGIRDEGNMEVDEESSIAETKDYQFRYVLLEGRPNGAHLQNSFCAKYRIPPMKRMYDIFDKKERKFIEVKVTKSWSRAVEEYMGYHDNSDYTALVHVSPDSGNDKMMNKLDQMPGRIKARDFLLKRKLIMINDLKITDSNLNHEIDPVKQILSDDTFNGWVKDWTRLFWDHRNIPKHENDFSPDSGTVLEVIREGDLKAMIEDTRCREAPFMQFHGKLLPEPIVLGFSSEKETDTEMITELFTDLRFLGTTPEANSLNWIISKWDKEESTTFNFINKAHKAQVPKELEKLLGIGAKTTIRSDGHPDLKQETFGKPPLRKYSAWLGNLIKYMAQRNPEEAVYFRELRNAETRHPNLEANIASNAMDAFYHEYTETNMAAYGSRLKNTYSRLGGSYLHRQLKVGRRADIVIFPLYSSGYKDDVISRKVVGFLVRGPQHATKGTDRIPIITCEMMQPEGFGRMMKPFIKNAKYLMDSLGREWCIRENSVMKADPPYLMFVVNSSYLAANMAGELTVSNPKNQTDYRADIQIETLLAVGREWIMERAAEGALMAVLGGSQEEGLMASLRKVFMLKLNWHRGLPAYMGDLKGFVDGINECLLDRPLALHMAHQFRAILRDN
jgi:hypothetical protein